MKHRNFNSHVANIAKILGFKVEETNNSKSKYSHKIYANSGWDLKILFESCYAFTGYPGCDCDCRQAHQLPVHLAINKYKRLVANS